MYDSKVLIVVDMQNDFIDGALPIYGAKELIPKIKQYIEESYSGGTNHNIIFTQDTHSKDYLLTTEGKYLPIKHCIKGTPGWCITDELFQFAHNVVEKGLFGFTQWLQKFNHDFDNTPSLIEIVGVATDICVISNALILRALCPNATIKVLADMCAGTSEGNHVAALIVMESCQIEVVRGDVLSESTDGK